AGIQGGGGEGRPVSGHSAANNRVGREKGSESVKLNELLQTVKPLAVVGPVDRDITGITYDSRRVMPGNLFVAMRGEHTDGHRFVEAAIERGASAVVLERDAGLSPRATRIKVKNARRTLALASAQFYSHPSQRLKVVGVTGTNGKTTTAFMVK